jgi:hypothetical protein
MRTIAPRSYRIRRRNNIFKALALIGLAASIAAMIGMKILDTMVLLHGH